MDEVTVSERALTMAARCWCDKRTEHIDMIPELAIVMAEKLDSVPIAFATLRRALQSDDGFAIGWHANIAMSAYDEGVSYETSQKIAARFMKIAFDVDVSAKV